MATARTAPRRTQEERSATTKAALLDATIECLVEYGYSSLTTTKVVERAGVSRGAQVHHFPTKTDLVTEALRHLAVKRIDEFVQSRHELPKDPTKRLSRILDLTWDSHMSPLFSAALELWVAARTDPELKAPLVEVERDVGKSLTSVGPTLFPELDGREVLADVQTAIATIRGLAMLTLIEDPEETTRRWKRTKKRLMRLAEVELAHSD